MTNHQSDENVIVAQTQEAVTRGLEMLKEQFTLSGQHLAADMVDDLMEHSNNMARKLRHAVQEVAPGVETDTEEDKAA